MAQTTADLLFRVFSDVKGLTRGTKQATKDLSSVEKASGNVSKGMSGLTKVMGTLGLAFGAREVLQWAGDALQLGIAADEVDSKFQAVYGTAEDFTTALEKWGDVAGVTTTDAKNLAATFGNLAMAQGMDATATEELALKIATLSGDMASFNDSDPAQVFEDLNKATLTTEREGLKKYGISVSELQVKTDALAIATADGRTEVTQADRAMASYEIILGQTGKAVGDLEKTQHSLANKQRQVKASVKEMQEAFGRELVTALADAAEGFDATEFQLEDLGRTAGRLVVGAIDPLTSSLDDLTIATSSDVGAWDRLTAAWRAGYGTAEGIVPPLAILDAAIGKVTGRTNDLVEATEDLEDEFEIFPYLQFQQGMAGLATGVDAITSAAGRARTAVLNIPTIADLNAIADGAPGGGGAGGGQKVAAVGSGVIPGRKGEAVPATLHAGERVIRPGQGPYGEAGGGSGVTIIVDASLNDPQAIAQRLVSLLQIYNRTNGQIPIDVVPA